MHKIECPFKEGIVFFCSATSDIIKSGCCRACPNRTNNPNDAFGREYNYNPEPSKKIVTRKLPQIDIGQEIERVRMENPSCMVWFDEERQQVLKEEVS